MPRLRRLSYRQVVSIFERYGFSIVSQRGSHIKLRRFSTLGEEENLMVPRHREVNVGTLRSIIRQASHYVSEELLREDFYTD